MSWVVPMRPIGITSLTASSTICKRRNSRTIRSVDHGLKSPHHSVPLTLASSPGASLVIPGVPAMGPEPSHMHVPYSVQARGSMLQRWI